MPKQLQTRIQAYLLGLQEYYDELHAFGIAAHPSIDEIYHLRSSKDDFNLSGMVCGLSPLNNVL